MDYDGSDRETQDVPEDRQERPSIPNFVGWVLILLGIFFLGYFTNTLQGIREELDRLSASLKQQDERIHDHYLDMRRLDGTLTGLRRTLLREAAAAGYDRNRATLGDEHPETLARLESLGLAEIDLGRFADARQRLEPLFKIHQRLHGAEHRDTLRTATHLAWLSHLEKESEAAAQALGDVLATGRRVLGETDPDVQRTLSLLERVLLALGRGREIDGYPGWSASDVITLIPRGSKWRYNDSGLELLADWTVPQYDDSNWPKGRAPLGYGDKGFATSLNAGRHNMVKHTAYYFRHKFVVEEPARFRALQVRLRRDDGAAVYINGQEILRDNLPENAAHMDYAEEYATGHQERHYFTFILPPENLWAGPNTIAVEVHQHSAISSDIAFDLSLEALTASDQEL